jgi:site-specific recombinase XerC
MDLQKAFEQFIQAGLYLRGRSPKTPIIYRRELASFTSFQTSLREHLPDAAVGGGPTTDSLTKAHLEAGVVSMRQNGMSPAGCNIYIRAMNAFCSWLLEQELLKSPIRLKQLPDPKTRFRYSQPKTFGESLRPSRRDSTSAGCGRFPAFFLIRVAD